MQFRPLLVLFVLSLVVPLPASSYQGMGDGGSNPHAGAPMTSSPHGAGAAAANPHGQAPAGNPHGQAPGGGSPHGLTGGTKRLEVLPMSPHGDGSGGPGGKPSLVGMAEVIKKARLAAFGPLTIGETFRKYRFLKDQSWHEVRTANGTYYVDFRGTNSVGWLKAFRSGIAARGYEVKFVVQRDGSWDVGDDLSRLEVKTNGGMTRYPIDNPKRVLEAIYANREIAP